MEEVRQVVGVVFGFGCCVMMEANFRFVVVCVVLWVPMGLVSHWCPSGYQVAGQTSELQKTPSRTGCFTRPEFHS